MLKYNSNQRITAAQACQHEFFKGVTKIHDENSSPQVPKLKAKNLIPASSKLGNAGSMLISSTQGADFRDNKL
jgi:hypothetical protein